MDHSVGWYYKYENERPLHLNDSFSYFHSVTDTRDVLAFCKCQGYILAVISFMEWNTRQRFQSL